MKNYSEALDYALISLKMEHDSDFFSLSLFRPAKS